MTIHFFHYSKSTSLGGIQTTVRELQKDLVSDQVLCNEFYLNDFSDQTSPLPEIDAVSYHRIAETPYFLHRKLHLGLSSLLGRQQLISNIGTDGTLVLFNPFYLLCIPKAVLKRNRVILVQANHFGLFFGGIQKLAFKWRGKYIDCMTVYTEKDRQTLTSLFPTISFPVEVIPRASKLDPAKQTAKYSKNLIFVGRIQENQKNLTGLCAIMALLGPEYQLSLYGGGSKDELEALQTLLKQHPNVHYRGETKDVGGALKEHSVFLMTSHFEGFGNTLIEARSQGLPLVAFDTFEALRWIIPENRNGFVIAPGDHQAFASAVKAITSTPDTYQNYSQQALQLAETTTKERVFAKWRKLLLN